MISVTLPSLKKKFDDRVFDLLLQLHRGMKACTFEKIIRFETGSAGKWEYTGEWCEKEVLEKKTSFSLREEEEEAK